MHTLLDIIRQAGLHAVQYGLEEIEVEWIYGATIAPIASPWNLRRMAWFTHAE
jgi:hypothetical protein